MRILKNRYYIAIALISFVFLIPFWLTLSWDPENEGLYEEVKEFRAACESAEPGLQSGVKEDSEFKSIDVPKANTSDNLG